MSSIARKSLVQNSRFQRAAKRSALLVLLCVTVFIGDRELAVENRVHRGRLVREWVQAALDYEHWQSNVEARAVVVNELRDKAVPLILSQVRAECHSPLFYRALRWQLRLPRCLWLLAEPEPRGKISCAAWLLGEMGEAARPAAGILARSLKSSGMHIWESQDVMSELIWMGPVAAEAAPWLRRIAADPGDWQCVAAAMALYTIEDETDTLKRLIEHQLRTGTFTAERELFWFRGDEALNAWLVPLLSRALADQNRSEDERKQILWHLSVVEPPRAPVLSALEKLINSEPEGSLRSEACEALEEIRRRQNQEQVQAPKP